MKSEGLKAVMDRLSMKVFVVTVWGLDDDHGRLIT